VKRFLIAFLWACTSLYGTAVLVSNPASLNTNDIVLWSQLGSNQAGVSQSFFAMSTDYESISGHFTNGSGTILKACSSSCGWQANSSFAANDSLLLTGTNTADSAPLILSISSPMYGVGTYIDAGTMAGDAGTQFTVRIQAYAGITSVLNTTVSSDSLGDAMFVGVSDTTAEITRVILNLTDSNGNNIVGNFVLDKLYLQNNPFVPLVPPASTAPEPGMAPIVGLALSAVVFGLRKRFGRA
jgi:hypothetical protein